MAELNLNKKYAVHLMLDSGVFSAWSHGLELTLDEYIDYLKEYKHLVYSYVNMDSVPNASSKSGSFPTYQETERSAKASYENQQIMKKAGLAPIPVFHQGEGFDWLKRYIDDGEDYIGISPWKTNITKAHQQEWFDEVFSLITDSKGRPIVRTHGFGVSSTSFMIRYPWFTLDSTTWVLSAGFGKIFVPKYKDGKPDYLQPAMTVITSGRESVSKAANKIQFENLGLMTQDLIRKFLEEEIGVTISEVRNIPEARRKVNLMYFNNMCEHLEGMRFKHKKRGLLSASHGYSEYKGLKETWYVRLMCATNLSRKFSHVMAKAGVKNRLLSYFELRDKPDEILEEYVKEGIIGGPYVQKVKSGSWDNEAYLAYRCEGLLKRIRSNDAEERLPD